VKCDVPQGTILGPLLFLLDVNGLPNCLHFPQPRMYADADLKRNLTWDCCHIQSICKKIASALGAIIRLPHLVPFNVLIDVYNSL